MGGKPCTMSLAEWWMVVDPTPTRLESVNEVLLDSGKKKLQNWPIEMKDADENHPEFESKKPMIREAKPLANFLHQRYLLKIDRQLEKVKTERLSDQEVIGARLYTGPMVRLRTPSSAPSAECSSSSCLPSPVPPFYNLFWCARFSVHQVQRRASGGG